MSYYPSAFISLNDVIKQFNLTDAAATGVSATTQAVIDAMDTAQRTLLKQLIFDVSDEIMQQWQRTFVPFQDSFTVTPSQPELWADWRLENGFLKFYFQNLELADCLSLSSVSIDGTALAESAYRLEGRKPYESVTFSSTANRPSASSFDSSLVLSGIWGYHENYAQAWKQIGTLQASLSDSATSFVATAGTVASFEVYQYLKIDSEFLFVTNVDSDTPYTVTVERGVNGTTAAAHDSADTISAYRQMPDVIRGTRRRVINLMQKRAELANLVQIGETAVEASTETISIKVRERYVPVKSV